MSILNKLSFLVQGVLILNVEKRWNALVMHMHICMVMLVSQSCPTRCDPMDGSPRGSSVHGTLQARTLEWVATPFSRGSHWSRDWTQVSCTAGRFLTVWATREAPLTHPYMHMLTFIYQMTPCLENSPHHTLTRRVNVLNTVEPFFKSGLHFKFLWPIQFLRSSSNYFWKRLGRLKDKQNALLKELDTTEWLNNSNLWLNGHEFEQTQGDSDGQGSLVCCS